MMSVVLDPEFIEFQKMVHTAKMKRHFDTIIAELIVKSTGRADIKITDHIRNQVNPRLVAAMWIIRKQQQ